MPPVTSVRFAVLIATAAPPSKPRRSVDPALVAPVAVVQFVVVRRLWSVKTRLLITVIVGPERMPVVPASSWATVGEMLVAADLSVSRSVAGTVRLTVCVTPQAGDVVHVTRATTTRGAAAKSKVPIVLAPRTTRAVRERGVTHSGVEEAQRADAPSHRPVVVARISWSNVGQNSG